MSVQPNHVCGNDCMCFAFGCQCPYCAPIVHQVDARITDDRQGPPAEPISIDREELERTGSTKIEGFHHHMYD